MNVLDLVYCSGLTSGVDSVLPSAVHMVVVAIKIVIPIILIIFGMIDLAKAVMSNDEKTMKESQGKFIKRIIYAVIIFFIVSLVQLIFGLLDNTGATEGESQGQNSCINCFINGKCSNTAV